MAWVGAVLGVAGGVMSYNASKKAGKAQQEAYEQQAKVNERNAKVLDAQALLLGRSTEYNIQRFRRQFDKVQSTTRTAIHKSGFRSDTGTGLVLMVENAREAQDQIDIMRYNTSVEQDQLREEALQQRLGADMNVQYGRAAKAGGYASGRAGLLSGVTTAASFYS